MKNELEELENKSCSLLRKLSLSLCFIWFAFSSLSQ